MKVYTVIQIGNHDNLYNLMEKDSAFDNLYDDSNPIHVFVWIVL